MGWGSVMNREVWSRPLRPHAGQRAIVEVANDVLAQAITERPATTVELLMRALSSNSSDSWRELEDVGIHRLGAETNRLRE